MRMAAALLALVALAVPPAWLAERLVGPAAPHAQDVVVGAWIWKGLLLLHAAALWLWARARSRSRDGEAAASGKTSGAPAEGSGPSGWAAAGAGPPSARTAALAIAGLLLVGLALRLIQLDAGLWFDEIKTQVRYVTQPIGWIVATYDDQNQHLLYSALARVASVSLGEGPFALRLPAVLFGVASLWAAYRFGIQIAGRTEAMLAAALLTVSYHHVWFSQNARGYTGLLFWTLLASALLLQLLRNREPARWGTAVAYAACMALALYTHVTAAAVAAAHAVIAGWCLWGPTGSGRPPAAPGAERPPPGTRRPARGPLLAGLILAGTITLQLYALVLPQMSSVLLEPSLSGISIEWKNPLWLVTETLAGLGRGLPGGTFGLVVAGVAGSLVGLAGLASFGRRAPAATAIMILPGLLTALVILGLGHNLWPRFFFFSAGFAVLIGLRGLFAVARAVAPHRALAVGVAVALLGTAASATTVPAAWGMKQDYDGAEAFVDEQIADGDAVVMLDMSILPYEEYRGREWAIVEDAAELARVEETHARTWLVYTFPARLQALQPDVWDRMRADYREAARFPGTVRGGDIVVMVRE